MEPNNIINEVEAPQTAKKNFWGDLWESILKPALENFWENNSAQIIAVLKTLATDLVKHIIGKVKGEKK